MISIISDPTLAYPDGDNFYSPDELFPEYRFPHISSTKNPVYRAVRDCFIQAGLDYEHFGQPSWNPLREYVMPGSRVFVLCNFVFHQIPKETGENFKSKCIHASVLRALIDYLLLAVGDTGSIAFGNAPMQFCRWEPVLRDTGANIVEQFYQTYGVPVKSKDLRLFAGVRNGIGAVSRVERRDEADGVAVHLDSESLMAELDGGRNTQYRIMNYSPKRILRFHTPGCHTYIINRHILEADVIVGLPKLKTHEKVGITCALKGCVGTVGHKDSLPHHRFGSPDMGGDEYPSDRTHLLRAVSGIHDRVQQVAPDQVGGSALRVVDRIIHRAVGPVGPITEGAWWGNDTAWRMVLDLARIVNYANSNGEMQSTPCRKHLALVDGIIGGEGGGPLFPTAVHSGLLIFGENPLITDYACASLMGFSPERIPMLREALRLTRYPLVDGDLENEEVIYNGKPSSISQLLLLAPHHYAPAAGWKGKL